MKLNNIDPHVTVWIGAALVVATTVAGSPDTLNHMMPAMWIPVVVAYNAFVAKVGLGLMTYLAAASSSTPGPLAPPDPPGVKAAIDAANKIEAAKGA